MAKYFDDNGQLKPEYLAKITALQDEVEAKCMHERRLMEERSKVLRAKMTDALNAKAEAHKHADYCYGQMMANDNGFNLRTACNDQKEKIMSDNMKIFNYLQDEIDKKDTLKNAKILLDIGLTKLGMSKPKKQLTLAEQYEQDEKDEKKFNDSETETPQETLKNLYPAI